ncbi:MAG: NACHT domain-containing protein [Elainella sp. Prado103]|nr:NACHT domain-containing protein [Elainella sp. Prado103]
MAKRSLQASEEGAKLARKIFDRRGWTQEGLAAELDLRTRQPIWRFFTSRPIERHIFIELCTLLDLDWMEIAEKPPEPIAESKSKNIAESPDLDRLAQQVRAQCRERIEYQCGTARLLGIPHPIELAQMYVEPNLLPYYVNQLYVDATEVEPETLDPSCSLSHLGHRRFSDDVCSTDTLLEQYSKLRILGVPGSGKTTLLKAIALRCIQGKLLSEHVPIFIQLGHCNRDCRVLGEFNLLHCIQQELAGMGIADLQQVEGLLNSGKCLLLLDELDEVANLDGRSSVLREIARFSERYYKNHVILASRPGIPKYEFLHFTDFEIAEFNDQQVETFARHWFYAADCLHHGEGSLWIQGLVHQLQQPENQLIRELAGLPLLLNRICQIFRIHDNLTKHCYRIYQECLQLLFEEWDEMRGTQNRDPDRTLTSSQRLELLSQIALYGIEQRRYCWNQAELESLIADYLSELESTISPWSQQEITPLLADLRLGCHGLLIQQAKGVFSFSHRAFQDYLIVHQLLMESDPEHALSEVLDDLTNPAWRGVFLLLTSLPETRRLVLPLMRAKVESFVAQNPRLTRLLNELQSQPSEFELIQPSGQLYLALLQLNLDTIQLLSPVIDWVGMLSRSVLFQSILVQLMQVTLDPRQPAPSLEVIQQLLDQAIELATSLKYWNLLDCLSALECLKHQTDLYSHPVQMPFGHNGWIGQLKRVWQTALWHDQCDVNWEEIEVFYPYLYTIALFQRCLGYDAETRMGSTQDGLSIQYLPQFENDAPPLAPEQPKARKQLKKLIACIN